MTWVFDLCMESATIPRGGGGGGGETEDCTMIEVQSSFGFNCKSGFSKGVVESVKRQIVSEPLSIPIPVSHLPTHSKFCILNCYHGIHRNIILHTENRSQIMNQPFSICTTADTRSSLSHLGNLKICLQLLNKLIDLYNGRKPLVLGEFSIS